MSDLAQRRFERAVLRALRSLPPELRRRMSNVAVVVEDEPRPEDMASVGLRPGDTLFGLYLGVPLTQRTSGYGMVLPDRIAIYRGPLERACRSPQELVREIRQTVIHEIAHHFGLTDADLMTLQRRRRSSARMKGEDEGGM